MRKLCTLAAISLCLSAPAHAEGDAVAGKAVFRKCAPCHSTEPVNRVGPTLAGVGSLPLPTTAIPRR